MKKLTKLNAFTLSETLITLAILGIVAAILIPTVIKKVQNAVTISKLKKTYSRIINSIDETMAINSCNSIKCVKQNNNVTFNSTSTNQATYNNQFDVLKIFIPDVKQDNTCIPDETYDLSGNKLGETYTGANSYIYIISSSHYFKYCLKDNTGLLLWNYSMRENPFCEDTSNCLVGYIYTGSKNSKRATIGKNLFKFRLNGKNELLTDDDTSLQSVIKNGWKINN